MLLPCVRCGHQALDHEIRGQDVYTTDDGAVIDQYALSGCMAAVEDALGLSECPCDCWAPDVMPHVTELLGLDVRSVIL